MAVPLIAFDRSDPAHHAALIRLWTAACGPDLAITERLVAFNTRPAPGIAQAGRLAVAGGEPAGGVLASAVVGDPAVDTSWGTGAGWIDAIAVAPAHQRQGIGRALLDWAVGWLRDQGCAAIRLGGGPRPFAPGLAESLPTAAFFERHGFAVAGQTWDVARRLAGYATPPRVRADAAVRPVAPDDEAALAGFLADAFPGRWAYEEVCFRRDGGRPSDYLLLWTDRGAAGFCRVTFEDSERPLDRFFLDGLPRPWGQLGPIGVHADIRGQGYGAALLDAGLRYLQARGVDGCVIDWTSLLDFYGKFGFAPHRRYLMLSRDM